MPMPDFGAKMEEDLKKKKSAPAPEPAMDEGLEMDMDVSMVPEEVRSELEAVGLSPEHIDAAYDIISKHMGGEAAPAPEPEPVESF